MIPTTLINTVLAAVLETNDAELLTTMVGSFPSWCSASSTRKILLASPHLATVFRGLLFRFDAFRTDANATRLLETVWEVGRTLRLEERHATYRAFVEEVLPAVPPDAELSAFLKKFVFCFDEVQFLPQFDQTLKTKPFVAAAQVTAILETSQRSVMGFSRAMRTVPIVLRDFIFYRFLVFLRASPSIHPGYLGFIGFLVQNGGVPFITAVVSTVADLAAANNAYAPELLRSLCTATRDVEQKLQQTPAHHALPEIALVLMAPATADDVRIREETSTSLLAVLKDGQWERMPLPAAQAG